MKFTDVRLRGLTRKPERERCGFRDGLILGLLLVLSGMTIYTTPENPAATLGGGVKIGRSQ
jgi:hypothetical protein